MIKSDILIIGAGPVGLFAVFEAGLLKMKCHLIDILPKPGGQCIELYPKKPIYDIPGYPEILAGNLIDNLLKQCSQFEPGFTLGEKADKLEKQNDGSFIVTTNKGTKHHAPVVVIAGGLGGFQPRKPNFDGIEYFEEKGVSYFIKEPKIFNDVKVPKENLLPNKSGLGAPLGCLDSARYGIAWGAIGAAMDCYDTALRYSKERSQFGKPIGGFQLQQKKLAEMITEITKAQLLAWRLGTLKNEGKATSAQISMAKRNNVEMAIKIAREARQILGGMGITGDYSIMRHMMNLESVITYEGTHDIHLLITGLDITGINAFK